MPLPAAVTAEPATRKHTPDPDDPARLWRPEYGVPAGHTRCIRCGRTFPLDGPIPSGDCRTPGAVWAAIDAREPR